MSKGVQFEREFSRMLRANGFDVTRGAASKGCAFGFDVDLVATQTTAQNEKVAYLILVQCKVRGRKRGKNV